MNHVVPLSVAFVFSIVLAFQHTTCPLCREVVREGKDEEDEDEEEEEQEQYEIEDAAIEAILRTRTPWRCDFCEQSFIWL